MYGYGAEPNERCPLFGGNVRMYGYGAEPIARCPLLGGNVCISMGQSQMRGVPYLEVMYVCMGMGQSL